MRAGVVVIVPLCCSCSAAAYRPEVAHKAAGDGFELAVTRLRITSMGEGIPPPGRGNGVQVTVTPKTTSPITLGPPRMVLGGGAACSDGIEARTPGSGNPLAPAVSLGVGDSERDLDYVFAR